jgi:hypothetical protein
VRDERYWAVDLPGLSGDQAEELLDTARALGLQTGTALDPGVFLTLALDEATVRTLAEALRNTTEGGATRDAFLEDLEEWLAYRTHHAP